MADSSKKTSSKLDSEEGLRDLKETASTPAPIPLQAELGGQNRVVSQDSVFEVEHLFGAHALFAGLGPEEIRQLVGLSEHKLFVAGEVLFEQGDQADALFILESGELQVSARSDHGEDVILALLGSGHVVGEMALIAGGPRSATVEALSDCRTYRLSRAAFDALRHNSHRGAYRVILNLARNLGERRRSTEQRLEEVFRDPAQHIDTFEYQVHEMLARLHKA